MRVGDRVREGARSGRVVALRPGGMADVQFAKGPIQRRAKRSLAKLRKNGGKQNPHLRAGDRCRYSRIGLGGDAGMSGEGFFAATRVGTVVAVHADSYDVRWDGAGRTARAIPHRALATVEPAPEHDFRHMAPTGLRRNHHLQVGEVAVHRDGRSGVVVRTYAPDDYLVHWPGGKTERIKGFLLHAGKPFYQNPAKTEDAGSEYLTIVAHAIYEGLIAKGKTPEAAKKAAFAIATSQLQKHGYLERGSRRLTEKGEAQVRKKVLEPDYAIRKAAIEHWLAGQRKAQNYRVVAVGKQFEVRPGGKRFRSEAKALEYAQSLGPVDVEVSARVSLAAEEARQERKLLEKKSAKAAREFEKLEIERQRGLVSAKKPKQLSAKQYAKKVVKAAGAYLDATSTKIKQTAPNRFEIVGTSKWFSSRAKAEAYLRKS